MGTNCSMHTAAYADADPPVFSFRNDLVFSSWQAEELGITKHRKELIGIVEFARLPQ
jgi:hypothetical protein